MYGKIIYVKRKIKGKFKIVKLNLHKNNALKRASTVAKNLSELEANELLKTKFLNREK